MKLKPIVRDIPETFYRLVFKGKSVKNALIETAVKCKTTPAYIEEVMFPAGRLFPRGLNAKQ
jgi:hypothetical protein